MNISILPLYIAFVFIFCVSITHRARINQFINADEARSVYALLLTLFVWTLVALVMGLRGDHLRLMQEIPWLWQAFVPVIVWSVHFLLSASLRNALFKIATNTPLQWLLFLQALRLGAIGGILKGMQGTISSDYVYWIGIPDFLFGLSALAMGLAAQRKEINLSFVLTWNLLGFSLIFFPTFGIMGHWMSEPGFEFIFEFPMILAPSIVVPLFISMNLMHAWGLLAQERRERAIKSMT